MTAHEFSDGSVWAAKERDFTKTGLDTWNGVHLRLNGDDGHIFFSSRDDVDSLIAALNAAANEMWPAEAV